MKIRIEITDNLYRRAKAEAALRGCTLDSLLEESLILALKERSKTRRSTPLTVLTRRARGVVKSGAPDLGSNAAHLKAFGRPRRSE